MNEDASMDDKRDILNDHIFFKQIIVGNYPYINI